MKSNHHRIHASTPATGRHQATRAKAAGTATRGQGGRSRGRAIGLLLAALLIGSCSKAPTTSPEEQARRDSAALHVAVMPTADCLPLYVAQATGLFDSVGVDVRLHTYQAQLDIDTAVARGRVQLAYSDLIRARMLERDSVKVQAVAAADADLTLVTARRGRVRKLDQLKEKMVAIARHSITDFWSDQLTDSARLKRDDIFRPQINSLRIRCDMILNSTMDAAFFPEPYATQLQLQGNHTHFPTHGKQPQLGAWIATDAAMADATRSAQMKLLWQAYDRAADRLNRGLTDSVAAIYFRTYGVPDSLCQRLEQQLPRFQHQRPVSDADREAALKWLRGRKLVR